MTCLLADAATQELKWNGWGFRDCAFKLNDKGVVVFQGGKYVREARVLQLLPPIFWT